MKYSGYLFEIFRISDYATASTDSAAYILGGWIGKDNWPNSRTSITAEYKNNEWRNIGNLNEIKSCHSAIFYNGEYFIVGGQAEYSYRR